MKQISYWAETATPPEFPKLSGTHRCDVAVAGGGLTGLTTALLLRRAGASVCVVEASRVGSGTSGRTTAKITVQHDVRLHGLSDEKAAAYAKANAQGFSLVASLVNELHIDCGFERRPACVYARNDAEEQAVIEELNAYERLGLAAKLTHETQLPFEVQCALVLEDQAQFHPLKYLYALADELTRQGVEIFENTPVKKVERDEQGVTLHTDEGALQAGTAVLATGYPLVEYPGLFFMRVHQERSYIIAAKMDEPGPEGMYISADKPTHSVRSFDTEGEHWLLAGGFGHKTGKDDEQNTGIEPLGDFLHKHFPNARAYCGWSAQDCVSLDGIPYVGGLHKKGPQVYVATGFAKWGMTNSAAAAMMIADDYTGGEQIEKDIRAVFSPLRVAPVASAKGFVAQVADVVGTFATGYADIRSKEPENLAAGEGIVCNIDGHAAAVGKTKDEKLHFFKAKCTHVGCPLEYNQETHSFDCKCHGSRFDLEGKVISGPAKQPLEPLEE